MRRTTIRNFSWLVLSSACALLLICESALAVTGLPSNFFEERNLPGWVYLGTDPACAGLADDCSTADNTEATGYTFSPGAVSTGGESSFNYLTLPDGTFGLSGQAVFPASGTQSTFHLRLGPGAPDSFRLWVVTDNGMDPNFNSQSRMRVNLRNTTGPAAGPPTWYTPDANADGEDEAEPGGLRLITAGSDPNANNGTADAWSFLIQGVQDHDYLTIRPTSDGSDFAGFAGFMIEPLTTTGARSVTWESLNSLINVTNYTGAATYHWFPAFGVPEPSSALLIVLGACGLNSLRWRRRSRNRSISS